MAYKYPTPSSGGSLSVPDLAALALLDDSGMAEGAPVYVETLRSDFVKRTGPAQSNSVTNVNALSGTAVWWRDTAPNRSWWPPNDFFFETVYIDSVSGDDQNDGLTDLTPVATLDEISRRYCWPGENNQNMFLLIVVGAGGASGTLTVSCDVELDGTITYDAATPITAVVNRNIATTTYQKITSTRAWTLDTFYRIVESNAIGFVEANPTGLDAETSFFSGPFGGFTNPSNLQTVQQATLPVLSGAIHAVGVTPNSVTISGLDIQGVQFNCSVLRTNQCLFSTSPASLIGISSAQFFTTIMAVAPQSETNSAGALIEVFSSLLEDEFRLCTYGRLVMFEDNTIVRAGVVSIGNDGESGPGTVNFVRANCLRALTSYGVVLAGYNSRASFGAVGDTWGSNNAGNIIRIDAGCRAFYEDIAKMTVTSASPNWVLASATGDWGAFEDAGNYSSIGPAT